MADAKIDTMDPELRRALASLTTTMQDATASCQKAAAAADRSTQAARAATAAAERCTAKLEGFDGRLTVVEEHLFGSTPPPPGTRARARPLDELAAEAHERATGANHDLAAFQGFVIAELTKQSKAMGVGRRISPSTVRAIIAGIPAVVAAIAALATAMQGAPPPARPASDLPAAAVSR